MKSFFKASKRSQADIEKEIVEEIRNVRNQLHSAQLRFEYESDTDLIDSAIYEVNALTARYRYLIRLAREEEIDCGLYSVAAERSENAWVH